MDNFLRYTVISFYFVGTKFRGLMMIDLFVDTWVEFVYFFKIKHITIKFVDCPTHYIYEIKCPMNKNDFTVL